MRIGYFGGSFDPPHRGHLAVARAARDRFALDRVLLAPTARQPFKPEGPVASYADRLRMTELLCLGEPALEASAIDGPQPDNTPNYTVDTLRRLHAELSPDAELFAILGADAFTHFPQWREPDGLLRLADWIIVSRPGAPPPALSNFTPPQQTRIYPLHGIADPVSATALRTALAANLNCTQALPATLLAYIHDRKLYRSSAA